jgi:tight adherence protein C
MLTFLDLIIQLLAFAGVVVGTLALANVLRGSLAVRRRLSDRSSAASAVGPSPLLRNERVDNPILRWVESATAPTKAEEGTQLRRDLASAGFEHPAASVWYTIVRFGLAIGLPVLFIFSQTLLAHPMTGMKLILLTLACCGLGLVGPRMVVDRRIKARRDQAENEFPDVLDLMVVCVEAGLGLEASFVRVGLEVHSSHPLIAHHFERLAQEMAAGRSRSDALRNMADRIDVESVKSFVALVIQTDSLGVSIGQTLRTFSVEMRERRFLRAEEKAMRVPVLMTVPITACFLPVIIGALLLPPIIDMMRTLGPALTGGH